MLDKNLIRSMAEAERMMDEGKIPWVMGPGPEGFLERIAVPTDVMEELGLVQGQTVNTMIRDAIFLTNLEFLGKKLSRVQQDIEDRKLDPKFDFRGMLDDNNS